MWMMNLDRTLDLFAIQKMAPISLKYSISGHYYRDMIFNLSEDFDEECHCSARGALKAEQRLDKFLYVVANIRYAAAQIIKALPHLQTKRRLVDFETAYT